MATIPTAPTILESAEYITSLRHFTQLIAEAWSLIVSEPATSRSREISQLLDTVDEFQTRFPVTLQLIVGDIDISSVSVHLRTPCPPPPPLNLAERFLQSLSPVSIKSLSCDDNTVPRCSICLNSFTDQMAQAPLISNIGENQLCGADPRPAETGDSIETPVRMPCGHVFGKECIHEWIMTCCRAQKLPECPECRVVPKGFVNPVQVITVLCPDMLNMIDEIYGILDELTAIVDASE